MINTQFQPTSQEFLIRQASSIFKEEKKDPRSSACSFEKTLDCLQQIDAHAVEKAKIYRRILRGIKHQHLNTLSSENIADMLLFAKTNQFHYLTAQVYQHCAKALSKPQKHPHISLGLDENDKKAVEAFSDMKRLGIKITHLSSPKTLITNISEPFFSDPALTICIQGPFEAAQSDCLLTVGKYLPIESLIFNEKADPLALERLFARVQIESLTVTGEGSIHGDDCQKALDLLPLSRFTLADIHTKALSETFAKRGIQKLYVTSDSLTTLHTAAKEVTCQDTCGLESLYANSAESVVCIDANNLREIWAKGAKSLTLCDCQNIREVHAGSAPQIDFQGCEKLLFICANRLEGELDLSKMPYLKEAHLNSATRISWPKTSKLIALQANKLAKFSSHSAFPSLETLSIAGAKKVNVTRCPNLKNLTVSSAASVKGLSDKVAVKYLTAPK